ncbi:MAG: O-antigen ligase family protein [Legionella sp.]|uniref:O-antigen ligase family protein n=1 Tax=Legionella sp. TaxID=459 RepID=UPI002850364B|nr:O-antigen ligase family protein [Legionella sp.]
MPDVLIKLKAYYQAGMLCLLLSLAVLWQSTQDSFLLGMSYALILASALVYFSAQRQQVKCKISTLHIVLILWLLWICIPPLLGWVPLSSLFGIFQCSLWIFIFFISDQSKTGLWKVFFYTLWLLGVINACYSLFQFFILGQMPCGLFMSKNTAAAFFMLTLLTINGQFLTQSIQKETGKRHAFYLSLLGISILILLIALFAAFSRGVLISLSSGLLLEFWLLRKLIVKKRLLGFIGLLLLAIGILGLFAQPEIQHRLVLLQREKSRWIIWQGAWSLWQNSPWHGIGIFNFMHYYPAFSLPGDGSLLQYAHNDFLQLLIETGLPGGLILLSLLIVIGYSFIRYCLQQNQLDPERHIRIVICFTALMSFSLHSMVDFNFYVPSMNLLLGCYLGCLHRLLKQEQLITTLVINFSSRSKRISNSLIGLFFLFLSINWGQLVLMSHYSARTEEAMQKGKYQLALKENQHALAWGKSAELYSQRADILLQLSQHAEHETKPHQFTMQANQAIEKAIAINPYYAHPYAQRALVQLLLNNPQEAQTFFYQALRKDPHDSLSRITFCRLLVAQQELIEAQQILEQGLNYPIPAEQAELYLNYLAKLRYENGEQQRALMVVERLKKLSYDNEDYSDLT